MRAIKQEHFSGCGVACVVFVTNSNYENAIRSFEKGRDRAGFRGFYCKEIIDALKLNNFEYSLKYVGKRKSYKYPKGAIVFLNKSLKYPTGHYLCFTENGWMDPWINFPRLSARAGFRKRLPGKPIYAIVPKEKPR